MPYQGSPALSSARDRPLTYLENFNLDNFTFLDQPKANSREVFGIRQTQREGEIDLTCDSDRQSSASSRTAMPSVEMEAPLPIRVKRELIHFFEESPREIQGRTPIFNNVPPQDGENSPKPTPSGKRHGRDWTPGSEAPTPPT